MNKIELLRKMFELSSKSDTDCCIDLAKREIVNSIYSSSKIEGIDTTLENTQDIIEKGEAFGVKGNDVLFVTNMKRSWEFILSTLEDEITLDYLIQLHKLLGNCIIFPVGEVRVDNAPISGTVWKPGIPNIADIELNLIRISRIDDSVERVLEYVCYLCKTQIFIDGNKRLAQLIANKV